MKTMAVSKLNTTCIVSPVGFAILAMAANLALGADWPEWRGPGRDGIVPPGPALMDGFAAGAPREVWRCRGIPGHLKGGYGSVSVAGGRAYVYANTLETVPQTKKQLTDEGLSALGWVAGLPDALADTMEQARLSPERLALPADQLEPWAREWLKSRLAEDTKKYEEKCVARLKQVQPAMPWAVLRVLAAGKGREFADAAGLRAWLIEQQVPGNWHDSVAEKAAVILQTGYDDVFCIDAESGVLQWTRRYPGKKYAYQCSATPCIADGRCYVAGSGASLYCLDAVTGAEIWKGASRAGVGAQIGASFVVQDGIAVLLGGILTGFDAATGQERWTQNAVNGVHASPARWRCGDRTYLVCNSGSETVCVDPLTGTVQWKVPGGGLSTPAISGDLMVVYTTNTKTGLLAYRLTATGAQALWSLPFTDRGASPVIHDGHVYAIGGWQKPHAVCVGLESGKLAWETKVAATEIASPVVADGKLWYVFGMFEQTSLYCVKATPEKYTLLGVAPIPAVTATSPAIVDGRIYLRLGDAVACYDLRR